nr:CDP-diacylglycerol--glycerol-3-phosphate 3-phosphatidyltransferase [Campylobacter sp.]
MNLPNALAVLRIILAPILFALLLALKNENDPVLISWLNYFSAVIFAVASLTDFFDGYIARSWNQKTKLGAILDPLADKMLTLAAFLGLMIIDRANAWAVYLILVREFFITGFRVVLATENINIAAKFSGKLKTTIQMIAIGFLCMQWWGGEILLWVAVILTLYSGFEYIFNYAKMQK